MKRVAISIGDPNGIGIQLALENHPTIAKEIEPIYCIDRAMLEQASEILQYPIPDGFQTLEQVAPFFKIEAGSISKESGAYAYASFEKAITLAQNKQVDAICTLPIHKKAWELAGIAYKGHTDALRHILKQEAIMMLGCPKMYVALFTEHIPLKEVASSLTKERLIAFLLDFYHSVKPSKQVAVLGLNPHAGDSGVLGDEEQSIIQAVEHVNKIYPHAFTLPLVPDIAFIGHNRARFTHYIAMYHDQGLIPLKTLYFEESINVSLNLPILRTSVDHGTAFDIAYQGVEVNGLSYLNAITYIKES